MEPKETDGGELVTAYTLKDPYKAEIIKNALPARAFVASWTASVRPGSPRSSTSGFSSGQRTPISLAIIEEHEGRS